MVFIEKWGAFESQAKALITSKPGKVRGAGPECASQSCARPSPALAGAPDALRRQVHAWKEIGLREGYGRCCGARGARRERPRAACRPPAPESGPPPRSASSSKPIRMPTSSALLAS